MKMNEQSGYVFHTEEYFSYVQMEFPLKQLMLLVFSPIAMDDGESTFIFSIAIF